MTTYRLGSRELEAESRHLTLELRESNDVLDDAPALRHRLAEDGYLLVRGLHDPAAVLAARRDILAGMAAEGLLDPAHPLGSLTNSTTRYRLSCDTRYQLASLPMDERWAGRSPAGHADFPQPGVAREPVEASRERWGV